MAVLQAIVTRYMSDDPEVNKLNKLHPIKSMSQRDGVSMLAYKYLE